MHVGILGKPRTSEALNDYPRAAVHPNAAIFELVRTFIPYLAPVNIAR